MRWLTGARSAVSADIGHENAGGVAFGGVHFEPPLGVIFLCHTKGLIRTEAFHDELNNVFPMFANGAWQRCFVGLEVGGHELKSR